jgi:hypothetical protein
MKKALIIFSLFFAAYPVFSQDLTSKKGEPILPEAKDWGLGIDATPFLNYIGNFFGKSAGNTAPAFNFLSSAQTISGKYFKTATTAYRAAVRIGVNTNTVRNTVPDKSAASTTVIFPIAVPTTENTWKRSITSVGLSAGIEKRRGKTRLQGIYGGEVGFYVTSSKDKFTYGNALSTSSTTPVDVGADDALTSPVYGSANNLDTVPSSKIQGATGIARVTERKNGATFSFGVRAFIGAEYFILPKMSIGGEFGWGLGASVQGRTTTTYESKGQSSTSGSNVLVAPTTIQGPKSGSFKLDTDNINSLWGPSAVLKFNLYF